MKPSAFVEWLHGAMEGTGSSDCKHIIRFNDPMHYSACLQQIKRRKKKWTRLKEVQPLQIIHALSCTLNSPELLVDLPFIQSVEPDTLMKVHAPKSLKSVQSNSGKSASETQTIPWGIRHIRAPQAWKKSKGDRIHIGVIDTGADYTHPDLRNCLSHGINLLNRFLLPNDDNGHGTHIAGTIAASSRQRGILGVAPEALIHPVKAFDHQGSAFVSDIINGIDWCVKNQIHIINMSFGMKTYSKALELAVRNAYEAGVIVVASSGNEGKKAGIDYPARLRQVIAVGATTRRGQIAPFSNISKKIDIYAPGERVYSTWLRGKYHELSGTSMATSHVTGVIALMLAKKPGLKPMQVKTIIKKNAKLILKANRTSFGIKEINAMRAVGAVSKTVSSGD
ncbi:S8 family peptidase [Paenibacillus sp. OAS669]|uniref:S8 family peptidase n=1 Tax=Paenibacillus sp. OAS669 TaxID=2663821 RepID=UPI001A0BC156|nr:S8 family peptidase [Paenibacillus sp. OAS669]MBE1443543.1 subtilisin [Paenibacillus sp. OAS669]